MLENVVGDLPRDPTDLHQVVLGRLPEIFRALETGVPERPRLRGPDPLDLEELPKEGSFLRTGVLEGGYLPLHVLVARSEPQRLLVRLPRVVVPSHLRKDVPLRDPRVRVPRVQLDELVVRLEGVVEVPPLLEDPALVQVGTAVPGLAG